MPRRKVENKAPLIVETVEEEAQMVSAKDETAEDKSFWNEEKIEPKEESSSPAGVGIDDEPKEIEFLTGKQSSGSGKRLPLIIFILLVLLVFGGGSAWLLKQGTFGALAPTPTPEPTLTPTPTPAPILRSDLKVQVLNGSGVPGRAGKVEEFLKGLGYQVLDTGNAKAFSYKKTEIRVKDDKKDYLSLLTEDVSREYEVDEETKTLEEESEYDAVVIVGSQKAKE